jgi:four helix bundle protein
MNYRNSKFKIQSSREAQSSKRKGSNGAVSNVADFGPEGGELLMLRDGDPTPPVSAGRHAWDLEERTAVFGERIIRLSRKIPRDATNNRLIDQLVGAGTSVGANYCEASQSVSGKDFKNTISRCVKEAKEAKFFLRMIAASEPKLADEARPLYREAHELLCIFASMRKSDRP